MFKIKIEKYSFNCNEGSTIFNSAKENNLYIENSCLNGRCKSCMALLLKGETDTIKQELGLDFEEKEKGFILTCVRVPKSDIELQVDLMVNVNFSKVKTIPTKIETIEFISSSVAKLIVRYPQSIEFNYVSGQYVNLSAKGVKRSYSIADKSVTNTLTFYIKRYKNGVMSNYIFNEAKINDLIRIEGPLGSFYLRNNSNKIIIFVATGTGIAPVKAILGDPYNKNLFSNKVIYLFQGGRFEEDLIEQDYFKGLEINYFPVLSRIKLDNYSFGYVQDILIEKNINLKQAAIYACGSVKMINETKRLAIEHGLSPKEFYSDAFLESN